MKMNIFRRFLKTRRSAVAVIMAVSLAPLMFLIGIAVDYTFLSQDRTQTAFAAEAAATQATRIAAATYAFEVAEGNTNQTNAAKIAIDDADVAGNLWYNAELGRLTRGTTSAPVTYTTYDGGTTGAVNNATPPNFQAQVSDNAVYPPIFNPLFGRTSQWAYNSNATAVTQFSYAQILLMLDTSGSMLFGADPSDISALETENICPKQGYVLSSDPGGGVPGVYALQAKQSDYTFINPATGTDADNVEVDLRGANPAYPATSENDQAEQCISGYGLPSGVSYAGGAGQSPAEPCALACHFTNKPAPNGYPADYYGLARANPNIMLRIDVMFQATEQVIKDMQSSEAVASQLSVGVYHFSTDVFPIVTASTAGSGALPEATSDLTTALSEVNAVDYKQNPGETVIPQLINGNTVSSTPSETVANEGGDTDFPLSLSDLVAGNAVPQKGGSNQPLTANGDGSTPSKPLKFMFIVTDGFEDDSSSNGDGTSTSGYNVEGEMTSIAGEKAGTGTCSALKNLGYTIYVLYVDYYPVASGAYYQNPTPGSRFTNANTNTDYPGYKNANVSTLTEVLSEQGGLNDAEYRDAPVAKALQACATTSNDFYEANSSSGIKTALSQMLKAALASTIRLTN